MKYIGLLLFSIAVSVSAPAIAQISVFPFSENFDAVVAPDLPGGWSVNGFVMTASTYHSSPNCLSATGNMSSKWIYSPIFDFTNRLPDKLIFWERRSITAVGYKLELRASLDGINYDLLLGVFDTIGSTASYIQRTLDLSNTGIQQKPYVRFQWRLLGEGMNNTGILRIDDVLLTMATAYDVGISGISVSPSTITRNDSFIISAEVKNFGMLTAKDLAIRFFHDDNNNGIAEFGEQFSIVEESSLKSGDSISCESFHLPLKSGRHSLITIVDISNDENRTNDTGRVDIYVKCIKGDILVNEFMYDPLDGQNEWIELFNRSEYPIDLAYWRFNDKSTSTGENSFEISDSSLILCSGCFAVVAADSSITRFFPDLGGSDLNIPVRILNRAGGFSFNNDGDMIVLKDSTNKTIDSVNYSTQWNNPNVIDARGRSLERINPKMDSNDPRNWSTCASYLGGTPGKTNSVFTTSITGNNKITISPNPFSPDGDGFEDFCMIHYNLPLITSTMQVKIYDIKGRLIRTLINGDIAGAQGDIIWDGLDNNKQRARIGVYIIYLEATDIVSNMTITAKSVVVIATRL